MNFRFLSFLIILHIPLISFGQNDLANNVLYIVDSIPIIEEPQEGMNSLDESVIDAINVVKNKEELDKLGYEELDAAIFIFTKEYINRPDEIKAIPSTKLMIRKGGIWYLKDSSTPYSGKFINYYLTGKKNGEGTISNGKAHGALTMYHQNGAMSIERNYLEGTPNGLWKEFYDNGNLKQKGNFVNGKEEGLWEIYFPNNRIKQASTFEKGIMVGESISYYSTGIVKARETIKDGKPLSDKSRKKVLNLYKLGLQNDQIGNFKASIKQYSRCIELDSTFVEAFFARGTSNLNNYQFDEAVSDFDRAIDIEPFYMEAYGNRAFCTIRKYQIENSRVLSKSTDVTILASKDNAEIPNDELKSVCSDLNMAISLGDKSLTVLQGLEEFCK